MPMPIYSVRSSMHNGMSSWSHPYAHANREIVLETSPIGGYAIPLKKPGIFSMQRLEKKAWAWHLMTSGARDLHTVQSFSKPGGMWPSASENKKNAKEVLLEIHYISFHERLRLPKLETCEYEIPLSMCQG
jgi:hypothetical protein